MKSKVVIELSEKSHMQSQCKELGIVHRHLKPSQILPQLEWFRLHKYIENYDQVLFLSRGIFATNIKDVFESHKDGQLGLFHGICFLADKSSLDAFRPPEKPLNSQQCVELIESMSPETYQLDVDIALVGASLKSIFKFLGFPSCNACSGYANKLDKHGVRWCEDNYDEVVQNITKNAKRLGERGGKLLDYGVSTILDIAIRKAKGENSLVDDAKLLAAKTFFTLKKSVSREE